VNTIVSLVRKKYSRGTFSCGDEATCTLRGAGIITDKYCLFHDTMKCNLSLVTWILFLTKPDSILLTFHHQLVN